MYYQHKVIETIFLFSDLYNLNVEYFVQKIPYLLITNIILLGYILHINRVNAKMTRQSSILSSNQFTHEDEIDRLKEEVEFLRKRISAYKSEMDMDHEMFNSITMEERCRVVERRITFGPNTYYVASIEDKSSSESEDIDLILDVCN